MMACLRLVLTRRSKRSNRSNRSKCSNRSNRSKCSKRSTCSTRSKSSMYSRFERFERLTNAHERDRSKFFDYFLTLVCIVECKEIAVISKMNNSRLKILLCAAVGIMFFNRQKRLYKKKQVKRFWRRSIFRDRRLHSEYYTTYLLERRAV